MQRLIGEAYGLQPYQVAGGPKWLDEDEFEIDARTGGPATAEQVRSMLRTLLAGRFRLSVRREIRELHVYELVVGKHGPKIRPTVDSEDSAAQADGTGWPNFHGDLQQFANLISVQLTIPVVDDPAKPAMASGVPVPVLDKTGLPGTYDIAVDLKPELGSDMFALWQRFLQDELGLKLESRKSNVEVLVVDRAERIPAAN